MTPRLKLSDVRRGAADWLLPPAIKRIVRPPVKRSRVRLSPAESAILAPNARLQDAYAGRRCFVLANGPSLAKVDISSFGDEITVVMNAFNQHPALKLWQPTVHCVAEPAAAYDSPQMLDMLRRFLEGYTSTSHVFPIEMKAVFDQLSLLSAEHLVFVKQHGVAADYETIDLTGPIPSAHDTSILAVSMAIAMGCNPIVLLGLDYNWLSHRAVNPHFYDDAKVPWPAEELSKYSYLNLLNLAIPCWEAHAALRGIAERRGQVIINATEGSFLDVYPTATLGEVLAGKHRTPDPATAEIVP